MGWNPVISVQSGREVSPRSNPHLTVPASREFAGERSSFCNSWTTDKRINTWAGEPGNAHVYDVGRVGCSRADTKMLRMRLNSRYCEFDGDATIFRSFRIVLLS